MLEIMALPIIVALILLLVATRILWWQWDIWRCELTRLELKIAALRLRSILWTIAAVVTILAIAIFAGYGAMLTLFLGFGVR